MLALFLFTLSAINPATLETARTRTADLFAPLLVAINQPFYQATEYVRAVSGIAELQAENLRLRQENARLRDWYQTALSLQSENAAMQQLLNIRLPPQLSFITAPVIADSGNAFAKSLLVMAGRRDGAEPGQAVLSGDGLIGRVIESGQKSSRILLLHDINSRIPVLIQGTNQRAILAGNNDELPVLLHLPPEVEIEPGARVITSGHGGLFPYGLPVGEVTRAGDGALAVEPYAVIERAHLVRLVQKAEDPFLRKGENTQ